MMNILSLSLLLSLSISLFQFWSSGREVSNKKWLSLGSGDRVSLFLLTLSTGVNTNLLTSTCFLKIAHVWFFFFLSPKFTGYRHWSNSPCHPWGPLKGAVPCGNGVEKCVSIWGRRRKEHIFIEQLLWESLTCIISFNLYKYSMP